MAAHDLFLVLDFPILVIEDHCPSDISWLLVPGFLPAALGNEPGQLRRGRHEVCPQGTKGRVFWGRTWKGPEFPRCEVPKWSDALVKVVLVWSMKRCLCEDDVCL